MMERVDTEHISIVDSVPTPKFLQIPVALLTISLTAFLGIGIWLFAPSDTGEVKPPPGLESFQYVDGVMTKVELPRLVMKSFTDVEGKSNLEFSVPESSLRFFDVVHMRAHSSIGLPTRIYFKEVDGKLIAVYKTDAPANSGSGK
jgi:hypothetical protein